MGAEGEGGTGFLDGSGPHVGPVELVVAAVEGGGVVAQQAVDDLQRFAEAPHPLARGRQLDAEAPVLAVGVAGADAELEAPVGYVVDRHRALREEAGVTEGVAAHQHPNPDPLGPGGERREQCPALVVGAGLVAGLVEVVAVPDAVESQRLEVSPALGQGVEAQVLVGADPETNLCRVAGAHCVFSPIGSRVASRDSAAGRMRRFERTSVGSMTHPRSRARSRRLSA